MQRRNHLQQELKKRYFRPIIDNIIPSNIKATIFIQELFRFLQKSYADQFMLFYRNMGTPVNLDNEVSNHFKSSLSICPNLKGPLIKLFSVHLDEEFRKTEFPGVDEAEIHTCIRELFHNFINPIPEMNIQALNTVAISRDGHSLKQDNTLFNTPADVQRIIHSYLDHQGALPYKSTCKSAYFLHKSAQDKPINVFYMLAGDVLITRKRGILEFDLDMPLRKSVTQQEIESSLHKYNKPEVKIFSSLFQALEYAEHLQHGGSIGDNDDNGYIPSLWAVAYIGNAANLQFTQEKITLLNRSTSSAYDENQRELMASYALVPKNAVQPLIGMVACLYFNFGSYKIFNTVNYLKPEKANNNFICAVM